MYDPNQPYNDLPLLPLEQDLETVPVLKLVIQTSRALEKLTTTAESLPNPKALYETVVLLESKASSELEGIVTTDNKLFGSQSSVDATDPVTKEVHRYAEAIRAGLSSDRPLCTPVVEEICSMIKDREMRVRKIPGTALKSEATNEVIYTPPVGESRLRDMLDNLFAWMNADDGVDPIIKAAIAHYQFEAIHPFTDGNGRTGRILVVLYLVEQRILRAPVLFLSGAILESRRAYYELLKFTTESRNYAPYLAWFLALCGNAALASATRALDVKEAMYLVKMKIREIDGRIYSQDLVNVLFERLVITASDLVSRGVAGSTTTAHSYLNKLAEGGVIVRFPARISRKVGYISVYMLEALRGEVNLDR